MHRIVIAQENEIRSIDIHESDVTVRFEQKRYDDRGYQLVARQGAQVVRTALNSKIQDLDAYKNYLVDHLGVQYIETDGHMLFEKPKSRTIGARPRRHVEDIEEDAE